MVLSIYLSKKNNQFIYQGHIFRQYITARKKNQLQHHVFPNKRQSNKIIDKENN